MTIKSQLDQVLALVDQFALTGRANWTHPKREVFANELRSRLSVIRAAVGGEAVAWMYEDKTGRRLVDLKRWHPTVVAPAGVTETPLYASPPATVDVGAIRKKAAELRECRDGYSVDMSWSEVHEWAAGQIDELAALIGKEA